MIEIELQNLGLLFFFALIGGIIASKIKQPIVLGLLLVGAVIGPFSLNLINSSDTINLVIEFGTILLLFVIGMEFSLKKMMDVGFKGIIITILKIAISFFAGFVAGTLLGLAPIVSVFLGVIISFSSTVVIVKVLEEKGMIDRKEMPVLLSILILEDIVAVITLTFFTGVGKTGSSLFATLQSLFFGIIILVLVFLLVSKFAERVVLWIVKNNSGDDVTTFIGLGICVAFAYLANYLGLSTASGAFLAGSIVSSFKDSKTFATSVHPYMQMFSSLFFIAIGTLINFQTIFDNWLIIVVLLVILIITRFLAVGLTTFLFANFQSEGMFFSTLAMFSVGEFSLIIAKQSGNFNVGIDLVSISAAIIFLTAIFMSISLKYNKFLYSTFYGDAQYNWFRSLGSVSKYLRHMFDELDTENTNTRRLKVTLFSSLGLIFIIFFTIIVFKWLALFLFKIFKLEWINYLMLGLMCISVLVMVIMIVYLIRDMNRNLSQILTNLDFNGNSTRTRNILRNLVLSVLLIFLGCVFPIIFVVVKLSVLFFGVSIILIAIGIWHFVKLFNILRHPTRVK